MDYAEYKEQRAQLVQEGEDLRRELNKTTFGSPEDAELQAKLTKVREQLAELEAQKEALGLQQPDSDASAPGSVGRDAFGDVHGNVYTGPVYHGVVPPDEITQTPERYLRALVEKCRYVSLAEIHPKMMASDHHEQRPTLDALYTTLLTTASAQEQRSKHQERQEIETVARLSALAQINQHQHLVLLGGPGSGKSTFVNFISICLAGETLGLDYLNLGMMATSLPDSDEPVQRNAHCWQHGPLLPIRMLLRDIRLDGWPVHPDQVCGEHLWQWIAGDLTRSGFEEQEIAALKQQLKEQGGLLLLDGLDEIPEPARVRPLLKKAIQGWRELFTSCRVLVTSRPYAYYTSDVWKLSGFAEAVLDDFHLGQIQEFLRHWYNCVGPLHGIEKPETCLDRAEGMFRDIQHNAQLQDLAKRPLLLTQMACLHLAANSKLPEKRVELYQQTVDLLLDRWELKKIVRTTTEGETRSSIESLFEILGLKKDKVLYFLEKLAFQAHKTQTPEQQEPALIDEGELLKGLSRLSEAADIDQRIIKAHLRDRAGILLSPGDELYTFPHRSFQEYLAACYWARQDTPEFPSLDHVVTVGLEDPLRWQEVMLLFGATQFGSWGFWPLIEALCPYGTREGETALQYAWGALWAGQILLENHVNIAQITGPNTRKLRRIADWLAAIVTEQLPMILPQGEPGPFPVNERSSAGNMLAQLGDPRPGVGCRFLSGVEGDGLPDIEWCEVPAGEFLMGSDPEKDPQADKDEQPQHTVQLSAFHISRYPLTNAQYQAFIEDDGYHSRDYWSEEGWNWKEENAQDGPAKYGGEFDLPNHPVVAVSWYEAHAYCQWLTYRLRECGKLQEKEEIRLPSEAEWEKASRGNDGRIFPWGSENITPELANYSDTDLGATNTVGCFPRGASVYGCEEMSGNVYEWCGDWFDEEYYTKSSAKNPTGPGSGSLRVIRGGYWGHFAGLCRAALRNRLRPALRDGFVGFRLLRTLH